MTRNRFWRAVALSLTSGALCAAAQAQETFKLGIVSFLSGRRRRASACRR
jgi:hypothetical protein